MASKSGSSSGSGGGRRQKRVIWRTRRGASSRRSATASPTPWSTDVESAVNEVELSLKGEDHERTRQALSRARREDGRAPGLRPQVVAARIRRVDRGGGGHRPAAAGLRGRGLPDPVGLDDPHAGGRRPHLRLQVLLRPQHPLHPQDGRRSSVSPSGATSSSSSSRWTRTSTTSSGWWRCPGEKVEVRKNEIFINGRPMSARARQGGLPLRGRPARRRAAPRAGVRALAREPGRPAAQHHPQPARLRPTGAGRWCPRATSS